MFRLIQKLFVSVQVLIVSIFGSVSEPTKTPILISTPTPIVEELPMSTPRVVYVTVAPELTLERTADNSQLILEGKIKKLEEKISEKELNYIPPYRTPVSIPEPQMRAEIAYPENALFQLRFYLNKPYSILDTKEITLHFSCEYEDGESCNDIGLENNAHTRTNCAITDNCLGTFDLTTNSSGEYYHVTFYKKRLTKVPVKKFSVRFKDKFELPLRFKSEVGSNYNKTVILDLSNITTQLMGP